ncbi:hypothetical protein B1L11_31630 [Microbispora sp. GKU 823]|nr:alpha/beta fold hydrolase [Microbispora sp. GKU 823]OPG07002.1 hypothetical protein B1L11_31630 [Microbispora sp. GKU 823]
MVSGIRTPAAGAGAPVLPALRGRRRVHVPPVAQAPAALGGGAGGDPARPPGPSPQPAFTDCDEAARWLAESLAETLAEEAAQTPGGPLPYALFGHSMGGMLGYRLTRLLLAEGGAPPPALLAVASWPVRGATAAGLPDPDDSDDGFLAALGALGGLPPEVADDPAMLALTLPVARADFTLCRSYAYRDEPPLPVPVAVFGGTEDLVAPPVSLEEWRDHTEDFLGTRLYEGGHFFLREHLAPLAASLTAALTGVLGRGVPAGSARWEMPWTASRSQACVAD